LLESEFAIVNDLLYVDTYFAAQNFKDEQDYSLPIYGIYENKYEELEDADGLKHTDRTIFDINPEMNYIIYVQEQQLRRIPSLELKNFTMDFKKRKFPVKYEELDSEEENEDE
jgi:hypothetical protein